MTEKNPLEFFKQIKEAKEALSKQIQKKGKSMLEEVFKDFFSKHPSIKVITWVQYTHGFNDGDPCYFHFSGEHASFEEWDGESFGYELEDGVEIEGCSKLSDYVISEAAKGDEWALKEKKIYDTHKDDLIALEEFYKTVFDLEVMEEIFGDGAKIAATADGITFEEYYDHD